MKVDLYEQTVLTFMAALVQNSTICGGSDEDIGWILNYARRLADAYVRNIVVKSDIIERTKNERP